MVLFLRAITLVTLSLIQLGSFQLPVEPSPCCPACSSGGIDPLNAPQQQQVNDSASLISTLFSNSTKLMDETYQTPIVNLTTVQELQILRNYPDLFLSRADYDNRAVLSTQQSRRRRNSIPNAVPSCNSLTGTQPLQLASTPTGTGSRLVQLVQMPAREKQQWHFTLTSCTTVDLGSATVAECNIGQAEFQVLYVDLGDSEVRLGYIVVPFFCEAYSIKV